MALPPPGCPSATRSERIARRPGEALRDEPDSTGRCGGGRTAADDSRPASSKRRRGPSRRSRSGSALPGAGVGERGRRARERERCHRRRTTSGDSRTRSRSTMGARYGPDLTRASRPPGAPRSSR
jgi:hypothetical protein